MLTFLISRRFFLPVFYSLFIDTGIVASLMSLPPSCLLPAARNIIPDRSCPRWWGGRGGCERANKIAKLTAERDKNEKRRKKCEKLFHFPPRLFDMNNFSSFFPPLLSRLTRALLSAAFVPALLFASLSHSVVHIIEKLREIKHTGKKNAVKYLENVLFVLCKVVPGFSGWL